MNIQRNGTQSSTRGPSEHFTGTVRIDPLFQASPPGRAGGAYVTASVKTASALPASGRSVKTSQGS
jgi:hypothetical protein